MLAGICHWDGDEQKLWKAMTGLFLDVNGDGVTVHDWEQVNATLIGRWEGGRVNSKRFIPNGAPGAVGELSSSSATAKLKLSSSSAGASRVEKSREEYPHASFRKGGVGGTPATEPPAGFPKTGSEAFEAAKFIGIDDREWVEATYHLAVSRGYSDAKGNPIRNFRSYLQAQRAFAKSRKAEHQETIRATETARARAKIDADRSKRLQELANDL
jgi:hypothetical protein